MSCHWIRYTQYQTPEKLMVGLSIWHIFTWCCDKFSPWLVTFQVEIIRCVLDKGSVADVSDMSLSTMGIFSASFLLNVLLVYIKCDNVIALSVYVMSQDILMIIYHNIVSPAVVHWDGIISTIIHFESINIVINLGNILIY